MHKFGLVRQLFVIRTADPVLALRGRMLQGASIVTTICALLAMLVYLLSRGVTAPPAEFLRPVSVLIVLSALAFFLAYRGKVLAGGLLQSGALLATILLITPPVNLLVNVSGASMLVPVFVAGLVAGPRATLGFGCLVLLLIMGISQNQIAVLTRQAMRVIDLSFVILMCTGLFWLASTTLERTLKTVQENASLAQEQVRLITRLEQERQARAFVEFFTHELGGLLSGVRGLLSLLPEREAGAPPASTEAQEIIGVFDRSLQQMADLVDDMRTLIRQGTLSPYQAHELALSELVARAPALSHGATELALQVQVDVPPGLRVQGDAKLLGRAINTALRNAIEAMGDVRGAGPYELRVQASQGDGMVRLRIEDTGPGFTSQLLSEVHALVERPEGSLPSGWFSTKAGGTGRGIPLMDQVMRLHKGRIAVGNRDSGPGAWVEFAFPKALEEDRSAGGKIAE